ncbi:MAG: hypothetical protein M1321_02090, partial [Candidatus Marsarchaeota archaeon]|nr:hypothetical protein [Candidatus Marsarchaeota archaeon]
MSSTTKNHDKKAVSDNRLRDATKAVRRPGRIRALAIAAGIAAAPILAGAQPASAWGYWKTEAFAARAQFGERYYGGEWRGGYCRYGGRNFGDSLARAAIAGAAMGITNGIISAFANNNRNYYQQPYYPNYYYQQPYYPNYYYQQPYYPNYYYQPPISGAA